MATLTIHVPERRQQAASNLRRWNQLLDDPFWAEFEGRIETDRHGQTIMSPPPSAAHGGYQLEIGGLLREIMPSGRASTECPISTADGVKAADVAWASPQSLRELGNRAIFLKAPEICVEVLSPKNREAAIQEKPGLYLDAGAKEVWTCSKSGRMSFFGPDLRARFVLCPDFPIQIRLK